MTTEQKESLERLIAIAQSDTGQARRVADFLLVWWNAGSCGGFDFTGLWGVNRSIADDMVVVFGYVARANAFLSRIPNKNEIAEGDIIATGLGADCIGMALQRGSFELLRQSRDRRF